MKIKQKYYKLIAIGLIAVIAFIAFQTYQTYSVQPQITIWFKNGVYYAKDLNGVITSSLNASFTINSEINSLPSNRLVQTKILLSGDIHLTAPIDVSNFTFIQIDGAVYLENGTNADAFTIKDGYFITIVGGAINANKDGQSANSNAISIKDSTLININNVFIANAFYAGVCAYNVNGSEVSGCIFKDNGYAITEGSGSIYWSGGYHNRIQNNNCDDGSFAEIMCADWLRPINDFTITGNEAINSFFGIVYCGNFGTISGNTLHARAPCDAGIYVNGRGNQGDINTVTGNTISGHMDGVGLEDSYSCSVSGNTIFATWGGHGIYVFGDTYSTNNTVSGNTIFNVAKNGILLWNASWNIVSNNRITDVNNDVLEGTFCGINATMNAFQNLYVGDYMDETGGIVVNDVNSKIQACQNGTTYIEHWGAP